VAADWTNLMTLDDYKVLIYTFLLVYIQVNGVLSDLGHCRGSQTSQ